MNTQETVSSSESEHCGLLAAIEVMDGVILSVAMGFLSRLKGLNDRPGFEAGWARVTEGIVLSVCG